MNPRTPPAFLPPPASRPLPRRMRCRFPIAPASSFSPAATSSTPGSFRGPVACQTDPLGRRPTTSLRFRRCLSARLHGRRGVRLQLEFARVRVRALRVYAVRRLESRDRTSSCRQSRASCPSMRTFGDARLARARSRRALHLLGWGEVAAVRRRRARRGACVGHLCQMVEQHALSALGKCGHGVSAARGDGPAVLADAQLRPAADRRREPRQWRRALERSQPRRC